MPARQAHHSRGPCRADTSGGRPRHPGRPAVLGQRVPGYRPCGRACGAGVPGSQASRWPDKGHRCWDTAHGPAHATSLTQDWCGRAQPGRSASSRGQGSPHPEPPRTKCSLGWPTVPGPTGHPAGDHAPPLRRAAAAETPASLTGRLGGLVPELSVMRHVLCVRDGHVLWDRAWRLCPLLWTAVSCQ